MLTSLYLKLKLNLFFLVRGPKTLVEKATKYALGFEKVKDYVFNTAKGKVMKQTQGLYPAPLKIIEVTTIEHRA